VSPASLGSVTDTLKCNWCCAYGGTFAVVVGELDVGKVRTVANAAIGVYWGVGGLSTFTMDGCLVFEKRLLMNSHPLFLLSFGLYCSSYFGILSVSILCTCCSHCF
jgi:hypothetical protein